MIHICAAAESVAATAADIFIQQARQAVAARGVFTVALSGGKTPQHCYELLARLPRREQIFWSDVHVFWGDERCVPEEDRRSNARMARQALLDRVPVEEAQVHPMRCSDGPAAAAISYENELRSHFAGSDPPRLDLIFLGLGEDGHTASLLPGSPVLQEKQRWVVEVLDVAGTSPEVPRITLTLPVINAARRVVFMVSGETKAEVVREVVQGSGAPGRLPAQLIWPGDGVLIWLLDRQAASLLSPPAS